MRKYIGFLVIVLSSLAFGQNQRVDGIAFSRSGLPAPGALVAVCTQPATQGTANTPCSPLAKLCSSLTDTSCVSPNPVTADGLGNYFFYVAPGTYTYQIYGSALTLKLLPDQQVMNGNSGGGGPAPTLLANCTAAGTVTGLGIQFANQVVGGVTQLCGTLASPSSTAVVAVCNSNCGNSGSAGVTYTGLTSAILDGTGVAGDYLVPSSTSGQFTDIGASKPTGTVETFGIVVIPNTGAGTSAQIFAQPISLYAPGSGTNSGNTNPAPQFQRPFYSASGTSNVLSGDACTTDGFGHETCITLSTNGSGAGTVTMGNGAAAASPAHGNSVISTNTNNGMLTCLNSVSSTNPSATDCLRGVVDVRLGYGASGGVDCTGNTDSTTILQAIINAVPDFSTLYFPANCKILVSTTSTTPALTIQSRYGLEFWFEGREASSCDTGGTGPGGAVIIDSSSYVSGARIFYINQSQRLLFHNLTLRLNGSVDVGFDVDQTTNPPITTANIWENNCVQNVVGSRNSAFKGWRFSNTATSNVESEWIIHPYIECSNLSATSYTSNGYGIWFGSNTNQKNEVVDGMTTSNCSADENVQAGSTITARDWMMSASYSNFIDGGFNTYLSGMRSEGATHAISVINPTGPHTYMHNDFASSVSAPIDCTQGPTQGCAALVLIGNEADTQQDYVNPASGGQNSSLVAFANRNFSLNPLDFAGGVFNIPSGNQSQFAIWNQNFIYNTFGEFFTPPIATTGPDPRQASPPIFLESIWNGASPTQEDWILQSNVASTNTDSTLVIGNVAGTGTLQGAPTGSNQSNLSTLTHWLAFGGKFSGINLGQASAPSILTISPQGTTGSTTYTYDVTCHGGNGITVAGATSTTALGNATLGSGGGANFNAIFINPAPGCVSYDVYRTACGGSGVCSTNPTGKIGNISAASTSAYINNGGGIRFADNGLSGDASSPPSANSTGNISIAANILISPVAPTIASGFGTTPSIVTSNGTTVFEVNVGTGGTATSGVITMPAATTGWSCQISDMSTPAKTTTETAFSTTSITLTASAAWVASDKLLVNCGGF